ncbi:MAG: CHASE2 domain-containing protein [Spirochaetales bacterium]|nr:CHASE2 domain-containing protein [Spirochaetales bacterium]
MNKKQYILLFLCLAGLAVLVLLSGFLFRNLNGPFTDTLFRARYAIKSREIVFPDLLSIQLDDNTIRLFNVPDNDRKIFTLLVDSLNKGKAGTIVFDILFRLPGDFEEDSRLSASLENNHNVIFPVVPKIKKTELIDNELLKDLKTFIIYPENKSSISFPKISDVILPYEKYLLSVKSIGGILLEGDDDGIIRQLPLLYSCGKGYIPSIILAGVCHYLKVPLSSIKITSSRFLVIPDIQHPYYRYKSLFIPLDFEGNMIINFAGPWEDSIKSYSVSSFLNQELEPLLEDLFENTLVIVADMTSVKKDFSKGIFDPVIPNSAILFNGMNTLLSRNFLFQQNGMVSSFFILLLFGEFLLFLILARKYPFWNKTAGLSIYTFVVVLSFCLFNSILFVCFNILPHSVSNLLAALFIIIYTARVRPYFIQITQPLTQAPSIFERKMTGILKQSPGEPENPQLINSVLREKLKLTQKEAEVAILLIDGKQYKEICALLHINESTVKFRIHRIYGRCKVGNKIEFCNLVREKL